MLFLEFSIGTYEGRLLDIGTISWILFQVPNI